MELLDDNILIKFGIGAWTHNRKNQAGKKCHDYFSHCAILDDNYLIPTKIQSNIGRLRWN